MWTGGARVVILDDDGRVLMLRQHHENRDIWMVPGGGIEEGENAIDAAKREVKEETGLDIEVGKLIWHVEEVSEKKGQRFVNFFLGSIKGGSAHIGMDPERAPGEQVLREIRFMSREEIEKLEVLYPEYLKDELWKFIEKDYLDYDAFKIRQR